MKELLRKIILSDNLSKYFTEKHQQQAEKNISDELTTFGIKTSS